MRGGAVVYINEGKEACNVIELEREITLDYSDADGGETIIEPIV
jgi:hypothetical protein